MLTSTVITQRSDAEVIFLFLIDCFSIRAPFDTVTRSVKERHVSNYRR